MKHRFFGHNFATVFKFEVVRTLKKKSFWVGLLAFPLAIGIVFGVSFYGSTQAETASNNLVNEQFAIGLTDKSGAISAAAIKQVGATKIADKNDGIAKVKSGELDAYFYYPNNLKKDRVEIFAANAGIFQNSKYQAVAQSLLQSSALSETSPENVAILTNQISFNTQTFRDGKTYDPLMEMIAPGIFLILFFLIIVTFGAQMLNAVVEEKENRVSEMILTTIRARTLIVGKIFAFLALILIQVAVILTLVVVAYLLLKNQLNLPSFNLSSIPLDPARIAIAFAIFAASLLLFSGLLVAIGAAMPTAKEANQFFAIPIILLMAPLYLTSIIITGVTSPVISFLTFFPFTAPLILMLRNALGDLPAGVAIIGVAILAVTAVVVFVIAAKLFQTGAVEYDKKMSLKYLFKKKSI